MTRAGISPLRAARERSHDPATGRPLTQKQLADLVAQDLGTRESPSQQLIHHWETEKLPSARKSQIALVKILAIYKGLRSREDADALLKAYNHAPLTDSEADSIFGSGPPPPPKKLHINIAPPMPSVFIGRNDALEDVKSLLKNLLGTGASTAHGSPVQIITAVKGWPGVGKTTLAVALAHQAEIAQVYPDGVLWASLGQQPNLIAELIAWTEALGIPYRIPLVYSR